MRITDALGSNACTHNSFAMCHTFDNLYAQTAARPQRHYHYLVLLVKNPPVLNVFNNRNIWPCNMEKMERHPPTRNDKLCCWDGAVNAVPAMLEEPGHSFLVGKPVHGAKIKHGIVFFRHRH